MKKALVVGAALGVASSADAAVFNVTSNADDGGGSLRQAIVSANSNAGADTITFDASLTGSTITLSSGEMVISDSVDIQGLGSANLTVDANETSRIFYIYNPDPTPIDVTISGLTLTNGFSVVPSDPGASAGGAIRDVGESLSLDDVHVQNSVAGGDGGGIGFLAVQSGSGYDFVSAVLSIENSVISGNSSNHVDLVQSIDQGGCGGGIFVGGPYNVLLDNVTLASNSARCNGGGLFAIAFQEDGLVSVQNSVVTGNSADVTNTGDGYGGGIALVNYGYSYGAQGHIIDTTISGNDSPIGGGLLGLFLADLSVTRSTISGNTATQAAGGVAVAFGYVTFENSTVAENTTGGYGGGVYSSYAELHVVETTISGNTAEVDGSNLYIYGESYSEITNSILSDSTNGADLVADSAALIDVQYSLIEDAGSAGINDNGGNIFGTDPQLGPLQDNGGPTFTMKPALTSPVIDAGDPSFTPPPATDQRGYARVANLRIDMGAVEINPGTLQFSTAAQNVNENAGTAIVTVTRTGGIDGPVSANVVLDGASTATGGGVDHSFSGALVSFTDNESTFMQVNVGIVDDAAPEASETVVLNLSAVGKTVVGTPATHTITILDNDIVAPPSADLSIDKTLNPGPLTQGSNVTFTLTVTNNGPDAATNVTVSDTLPPQLTWVSSTPSQGSCSGTTTITCNLGTINAPGSATISIVATLTGSGPATNTATVSSTTGDSDGTDNADSVTFTIAAADVAGVPALDTRMQILLAALLAAIAVLGVRRP